MPRGGKALALALPTMAATEHAPPSLETGLQVFATIVERIEIAVDAETEALRSNAPIDLVDINRRKRQGFLELTRLLPQLLANDRNGQARERLGRLSDKLARNRSALDIQLCAVREVAGIIERTLRDAESDGTYSYAAVWP